MAVPPGGGIYYVPVYLVWSSEDAGYASHRPSPHSLEGGRQMMETSRPLFLVSSRLVTAPGGESSLSSTFRLWKLRLNDDIASNANVSQVRCPSAVVREYWTSL